ncbi:hypothetical protein ACE6ED_17315 [Paenibacillus sp. CN-4]|uniref:hypothetical protein n=1 Tax=Paenibacillus nanchangensis TaxID=3348343 RepID=UPI003979F412
MRQPFQLQLWRQLPAAVTADRNEALALARTNGETRELQGKPLGRLRLSRL